MTPTQEPPTPKELQAAKDVLRESTGAIKASSVARSYFSDSNAYHRTTIVIDRFDDGSEELVKNETVYEWPPCQRGGCRASSPDSDCCGFDPKTGLCDGRMA